jgi:hypothetical protein
MFPAVAVAVLVSALLRLLCQRHFPPMVEAVGGPATTDNACQIGLAATIAKLPGVAPAVVWEGKSLPERPGGQMCLDEPFVKTDIGIPGTSAAKNIFGTGTVLCTELFGTNTDIVTAVRTGPPVVTKIAAAAAINSPRDFDKIRNKVCDEPDLVLLARQCRFTCATCCELPEYDCQNDPNSPFNCDRTNRWVVCSGKGVF